MSCSSRRSLRLLGIALVVCQTDCTNDKGISADTGAPDESPSDPCWYTGECAPLDICDNGLDDDDNGLVDEEGCSVGFLVGDTEDQFLGRYLSVDPANAQHWLFGGRNPGSTVGMLGSATLVIPGELVGSWNVWNREVTGDIASLYGVDESPMVAYRAADASEEWTAVVLGRVPTASDGAELETLATWELPPLGADYNYIRSVDAIVGSGTSTMVVGTDDNFALLIDSPELASSTDMVGDARTIFTVEPEVLGFGRGVGLLPNGAGDGQTLVLVSASYWTAQDDYTTYSDSFMWAYYSSEAGTVPTDAAVAVVAFGNSGEAGGHPRPAGDVDADGYTDVIVDMFSGTRMVLFGPLLGELSADEIFSFGGNSVTPLGDLDGDGYEDLLASVDWPQRSVCVAYGPLPHEYATLGDEADACLNIESSTTNYTTTRSVFADVTGDSVGEIIVSNDTYSIDGADDLGLIAAFPVP